MASNDTRVVRVNSQSVAVDQEGYLIHRDDWSEDFARALAREEGLALNDAHWQVIRFLREYFESHGVQAAVHIMIKHFRVLWGPSLGGNRHLHDLFPRGGPQKQGNRLAGIPRTRGEH
jgi:tRNA 2-thiouridine synthesizing protein E